MSKKIVPCDVCIKRFYRMYVHIDDDACHAQIVDAAKQAIVDEEDDALTPDPDLNIEEHDIVFITPDYDSEWTDEDEEDIRKIMSSVNCKKES